MSTQSEDYIPESFEEEMLRREQEGPGAVLADAAETVTEKLGPPARVVQEVFYEPPVKFAFVGFAVGSAWTALIFSCAFLINRP